MMEASQDLCDCESSDTIWMENRIAARPWQRLKPNADFPAAKVDLQFGRGLAGSRSGRCGMVTAGQIGLGW